MDEIELTIRLIMNHKEACQVIGRDGSNIKTEFYQLRTKRNKL